MRDYDGASGQFTQQDPIGIAGGLNLYGYANGDPINFSDPFGLKVRFAGPNAEQLEEDWNRLLDRAKGLMQSDDKTLRHAGALIATTMEAMEAHEQTIWIGQLGSARPARTTATWKGESLSTLAIGVNTGMYRGYSSNGRQEVLAHESGHAVYYLLGGRGETGSNRSAVKFNNAFRTMIGCQPQLTTHGPQTICR